MVTRPVIASTASTTIANWFIVRLFKCGLSVLRVAMISFMVRFGLDVGCCDEPPYSTFSDHPSLYNNYAFAIVRPTGSIAPKIDTQNHSCHLPKVMVEAII